MALHVSRELAVPLLAVQCLRQVVVRGRLMGGGRGSRATCDFTRARLWIWERKEGRE
jgi:hypothetical protein